MSTVLPLPKYHQIYLVLREQLHEGRFVHGLPSELAVTKEFSAGRVTVRRALEQLAKEGLIVRQAGRGTRPMAQVSSATKMLQRSRKKPYKGLTGLMENIVSMGMRTAVKVLEVRLVHAAQNVADALQIPLGSKVQKAVRQRSSPLGPVSYITTYVPEVLASGFGRKDLLKKPMLRLIEESGVQLGRARQTVTARQADAVVAAELGVAVGTALLAVHRVVFDINDRPVQWLHGLYRPDRYEYQMEVSQVGSIDARISVKESLSD